MRSPAKFNIPGVLPATSVTNLAALFHVPRSDPVFHSRNFAERQVLPIYAVSFALFVGNWVCVSYGLPFSVASPLWSISVEEQFYIGWPLLLRFFGIHRIKVLVLLLLAIAFGTRVFMAAKGFEHPAVWCNTLARLDPIAIGAVLAVFLRGRTPRLSNVRRVLLGGVAIAGFVLAEGI